MKTTSMHVIKPKDYSKVMGPMKDDKHYPCFSLDLANLPEAKSWKVGNEYTLVLKVKQSGMHEDKNFGGSVSFEIHAVGVEEAEPASYSRLKKKK